MTIVKLSSTKADLDREAKGDWIEAVDHIPGVSFLVSSLLLPAYRIDRDLVGQRLSRQFKGKPIPPDAMQIEIGKLFAKHILHGWKGFDEPYTKQRAEELLTDPSYRLVVSAVEWCAAKMADVDVEFVEDAAKNSERPSETD